MTDHDDIPSNPTATAHFNDIVRRALSRRGFLKAGLGAGAVGFMGTSLTACGSGSDDDDDDAGPGNGGNPPPQPVNMGFKAVPISVADTVTVPEGYAWAVINRWGDKLHANSPAFRADAGNTGDEQALQIGYNHDGMHFFPIDGTNSTSGSSDEGLMVTNHEYITPHYFFPLGVEPGNAEWTLDWVRKSQYAQGVSVIHMRRNGNQWEPVLDSPFNRSINGTTAMQLVGPAAGSRLTRTNADATGTRVFGTFGNCGNGYTLWNTYLTCEENFTDYFGVGTKDAATVDYPDAEFQAHMERYKGSGKTSSSSYRWDTHDTRFDWSEEPNEYNRFGWVVEIDPFDPNSTPKKLTALGRFKHENAAMSLADDGRVVVYMGDDQVSEYVYKFVSDGKYDPATPALNRLLLDRGTLYVARFLAGDTEGDAMGTGEWVPLKLDTPALAGGTLGDLFNQDMGELLVKTRQAADAVGATPMDRPEWVAVHPATREVYVTMTNNSSRGSGKARYPGGPNHPDADEANPRVDNIYGQIVRWREQDGNPTALSFEWDIFVLAGNPTLYDKTDPRSGSDNVTVDNTFNSPDGLAFDPRGLLWIETDGNYSNADEYAGQGHNQMLVANPATREIRRFMTGPVGCEVTGITWTPDQKFLFINIQHPGEGPGVASAQADPLQASTWPDGAQASRPRPATVVIWKEDGGIIGT
ncbi:PhoX family protein [Bordetella genomosp. 2]|uniref:Transcriptional initiation protein Tat n=1 Tax=Bordetella genomosp. 2 TaxID=1983456 RepID=A0A261WA65_9BORD|nr:PhoX family phosphatase [Bordetella genomosp. 2]OZI82793.1 transcriptional initiation protein Tat [Bordetella genomosp. 2]